MSAMIQDNTWVYNVGMHKTIFVVVGLVTSDDGKILVTQRNEPELPAAHLKWELPGGKVAFGESAEDALKREIHEETGYTVKVGPLLPHTHMSVWYYKDIDQHTVVFCFRCSLVGDVHENVHDHHVADMRWVSQSDAFKLDSLPGLKEFISMSI
jgi:mutator protein MutT